MKNSGRVVAILWIVIGVETVFLLCLISLNAWGLGLFGSAIDYARFGTWSNAISGFGTTLGVVVALSAQLWQRQVKRSDDHTKELESETALYHWLVGKEVHDERGERRARFWDMKIQNTTEAPIYRWKVGCDPEENHLCSASKRALIPGVNLLNLPFLDDVEPDSAPELKLFFEDRSGRLWCRSARGSLMEASDEDLKCSHAP